YATRFYPRSVNRLMTGKVALPRASLEHIIRSIAQGAWDLRRVCGRSHGDIRPTNVQVGKGEKLAEVEVVLCDPLPDDLEKADAYERSDLHAIGLILLQLVRQRVLSPDDVAVMLPIPPSPEWTRIFGSDASDWLALCNRLLDPHLTPGQFTLEQLVNRLEELKPKPRKTPNWVIIGASGFVFVLAVVLWLLHPNRKVAPPAQTAQTEADRSFVAASNYQKVAPAPIAASPATSQVAIVPETKPPRIVPVADAGPGMIELRTDSLAATVVDSAGHELGHISPNASLKLTLPAGTQSLSARVPGLDDAIQTVRIDPAGTSQYTFQFNYGTVDWTSPTVPVTISAGGNSRVTPASFIQKPDVPTEYILVAAGYQGATNTVVLTNGERRSIIAQLTPLVFSVALVSDPPGAQFFLETGEPFEHNKSNPSLYDVTSSSGNIIARLSSFGALTSRVDSTSVRGAAVRFKFDYGILS